MTFDHRSCFPLPSRQLGKEQDILANWLSSKVENSFPFSLLLANVLRSAREQVSGRSRLQSHQSQIQSQAWRNLLNHLEKRKGGCVSISILLVFEISVLLRAVRGCRPRNDKV